MKEINGFTADRALMARLMERMMLVRKFEERAYDLFARGEIYGTMHLGVGEEAANVGSTAALKESDYMLATHRGHGQAIGKGVDVKDAMAELMGRVQGTNRGLGGSMHIADIDKGVLGANGIVGAGCPIACGAGLYIKMNAIEDRAVAVFFGDGASNEGAVHESMNLASVWGLPVIFILVNNTYGMSTPIDRATKDTDLKKRALPFSMMAYEADGNDVLEVYATVSLAREYAVKNSQPVLVVEHTYRTSGHSKSDGNLYRTREEIDYWKERNPISRFSAVMLENGFSQSDIDGLELRAKACIDEATEYAKCGSAPSPEGLEGQVYA